MQSLFRRASYFACGILAVASGCDRGASVPGFPATIGPVPTMFTLPARARRIAPEYSLSLRLASSYGFKPLHQPDICALYWPNGRRIVIHATWIGTDSSRHPLDHVGCSGGSGTPNLELFSRTHAADPAAVGVALYADSTVTILRARWWSGDPASSCFLCM